MFSMQKFCFSCLKNTNTLLEVTTSVNDVTYEEKLIYCRLFYNVPETYEKLLCNLCCTNINNVYEFKKKFMEKQELLQTYIQSLQIQNNVKKCQKMSVNVLNCHEYIPKCPTEVMKVDLTVEEQKDDQIFDLTADDEDTNESLFDNDVNTVNFTLSNPFVDKEPKMEEIVEEDTQTNQLLQVIVKTNEDQEEPENDNLQNEREFINSLPRIEENYEVVGEDKVSMNNNGLKIVIRKNNSQLVENEKFECVYCNKILYNAVNLRRHERRHPKRDIPCRVCKKILKNRQSFLIHKTMHTGDYKFHCNICKKGLSTKQNWLYHKKMHLKKGTKLEVTSASVDPKNLQDFQNTLKYCNEIQGRRGRPRKHPQPNKTDKNYCKKCNFHFATKSLFLKHYLRHHTVHTCEYCDSKFDSKQLLTLHFKNGICPLDIRNNIHCNICDKYFATSVSFNKHMGSSHTDHKCHKCQMVFKNKIMLRHHQKKNCQQLNFKCEFCNKCFKLSIQLNHHLKTHIDDNFDSQNNSEITSFQCDTCGKCFANKVKRDLHLLIHSGIYNYSCTICLNSFTTHDQLQSHITRIHRNKLYHCKICLKSFKTIIYLKRHMQANHSSFAPKLHCEFCTKTFTKYHQLKLHKRSHTNAEKIFDCSECSKVFVQKANLIRHMVTHTKERNHVCKYCGKKFNFGNLLIRHIKNVHMDDEKFENDYVDHENYD